MLDKDKRKAIPLLRKQGYGERKIARILKVSRTAVRKALREGGEVAPRPERQGKAEPNRERIILETRLCQGNLSLVHEELVKEGIDIGYSTVARFVHDNELLKAPKPPAGRYEFGPGVEMQFDTSPHRPKFKNGKRKCQCASLAFKYSHAFFFQYYPRFSRFEARVFLTEAARYFEGVCGRCIIDNSNVVLLHGTGENAVPCPEFEVFGKRFGFKFEAHEIGDKDRSGAVERPFHYYENNFLRKRVFENFPDLNAQATQLPLQAKVEEGSQDCVHVSHESQT